MYISKNIISFIIIHILLLLLLVLNNIKFEVIKYILYLHVKHSQNILAILNVKNDVLKE